ncbi:MAG: hypothetical protein ACJ8DF_12305, partial [Microvirga sp.]
MRRVLIFSLLAFQTLTAQNAVAQASFGMSPGAPSTPPAARPAPQLGPAQQAPSAAAPFEMRQPSSAPSTPPAA